MTPDPSSRQVQSVGISPLLEDSSILGNYHAGVNQRACDYIELGNQRQSEIIPQTIRYNSWNEQNTQRAVGFTTKSFTLGQD